MEFIARFCSADLRRQPLSQHIKNVAKQCRQRGQIIGCPSLCGLAGWLHDAGKYTDTFQGYLHCQWERAKKGQFFEPPSAPPPEHSRTGAAYLYERFHEDEEFHPYAPLASELLAMILCYHHDGMRDFITPDYRLPLLEQLKEPYDKTEQQQVWDRFFTFVTPEVRVEEEFYRACKELKAFCRNTAPDEEKAFEMQMLLKNVYSILLDADRKDAYSFTTNELPDPPPEPPWAEWLQRLEQELDNLLQKEISHPFEETICRLRQEISDACAQFAQRETGIYTLTIPPGSGKTLASLRFALEHARLQRKERILFVLPCQSILEQTAEVIRNILQCGNSALEYHTNVFRDMAAEKYSLLTQRWDSPIVLTTLKQFLNTFYAAGTQSLRRLHHLTNAVVLIDNLSSIPVKYSKLFTGAVQYLYHRGNSTVVLGSAVPPDPAIAGWRPFLSPEPEMIPDVNRYFQEFRRVRVVDCRQKGEGCRELVDFVQQLIPQKRSILIVLNTKDRARHVFEYLRSRIAERYPLRLRFLSSDLCPAHRLQILRKLKEELEQEAPVICVSTPLIETGANCSFDCVIRQLTGLHAIVQSFGLQNRHGRNSPDDSLAYIIRLQEEHPNTSQDIHRGEEQAALLLDRYQKNPGEFQENLLSPPAIRLYDQYLYQDTGLQNSMSYPLEQGDGLPDSIYAMLTQNQMKNGYGTRHGSCPLLFSYLLGTAASEFQAEDDRAAVIVPYGASLEWFKQYRKEASLEKKQLCLQHLQQFVVSVHAVQLENLEVQELEGLLLLKEGYYDNVLGMIEENQKIG